MALRELIRDLRLAEAKRTQEQTMSGAVGGGGTVVPGATTSANVGGYPVPLGTPLRRTFPKTKGKRRTEATQHPGEKLIAQALAHPRPARAREILNRVISETEKQRAEIKERGASYERAQLLAAADSILAQAKEALASLSL